jgi:hypothetical protein
MDAGLIIAIVVIALLVLAAIVILGRRRAERQRLAKVQTSARRDDAQYERHTAGEHHLEAEEAEERAARARARAEEHEERAAIADPDVEHDGSQDGRPVERERER